MGGDHPVAAEAAGWSRDDVRRLYQFVLRREPESEDTVASMLDWPVERFVRTFFSSPEFVDPPKAALERGERPWPTQWGGPSQALKNWAAKRLPMSKPGRRALRAAPASWTYVYHLVLADPVVAEIIGAGSLNAAPYWERIQNAAGAEGRIEEVDGRRLRGWAVGLDGQAGPVVVEAWSDGVFRGAAQTEFFRRDVQDRFGGEGLAGFVLEAAPGAREHPDGAVVELRLRSSGALIGAAVLSAPPVSAETMAAAGRELEEIRRLLGRLEERLPWIESSLAQPLADYSAYAETWRDRGLDAPLSPQSAIVVVDAAGASPRDLDATVESVLEQTIPLTSLALALIVDAEQETLAMDMAQRCSWRGLQAVSLHSAAEPAAADRVMAAVDMVGPRGAWCLALEAGSVLSPGALRRIGARMDRSDAVQAVYFDEDRFEPGSEETPPAVRPRCAPQFKPGFDGDLLRQTPYLGRSIAFRTGALTSFGLSAYAGAHYASELVMRLVHEGAVVDHVARVLLSRWETTEDPDLWPDVARRHLGSEPGLIIEAHRDEMGGVAPGALRLRRIPTPARAAIIIATRDSLDLLRPCVDSILERQGRNSIPHELIIIDHQSEQAETRAYLDQLQADGAARILPFEGEFNWALMNNLAAAQTDAEILVFLNNDTVVLTPDWLDELVSQAQRPEIGVVGCRLLYGDGTIQHAGFVAREEVYSFLIHEGVGEPASDPGYLGRRALMHDCVAVTGACMAVRAEVFRALGGFDAAAFPIEGNDVDLCLKARADGLKVLYDPYVTLYHLESKTRGFDVTPESQARAQQASRLLWKRWGARFSRDPGFNPHFDRLSQPFRKLRPPPAHAG